MSKAKKKIKPKPKAAKKYTGNKFWMARSSHGREPIFKTKQALWKACIEYFEWVHDNPLKGTELVKHQGHGKEFEVSKMRAMTISGLCIFLGISRNTWTNYRERKGFEDVTSRVDDIIYTQKFEGAAGGLLNPVIIARELGLADKQTITATISEEDREWLYNRASKADG